MTSMHCRVATTQRELDDALRVRWAVFGGELRLISGKAPPSRREVSCFDTLETTVHLVVYADREPVATLRMLMTSPEVALATGGRLGIELEQKLDLSGLGGPGMVFAETARFCVLERWRHSEAVAHLQAGIYAESRGRGVTHWIAAANLDTDSREDASLIARVAAHRGWVSPRWRVRVSEPSESPVLPSSPFYTPMERERAGQGNLGGLRMPRAPSLFARKMGARFIAEPLYDASFRRFTLPLLAALDEIPASTLERFRALDGIVRRAG
ncbi:GNAT family N-acetyltransferase [Myxococcus sp. CA051A]|uniref:GNAT family N-acyltransferase n=1 Tax=unclassified Myxococcus TaxID=2648731 RepID=UPI00157B6E26|nr:MULTISPECIES: GNAT family N-acyltransferase [unclassified Myxococcus]NTX16502.1 GNAT family N-acetyltransferase [Myxococcus sp. CA056]NTX38680.1 GNAT family N-acetyltransferase [Myxococcus sp. CA033]NTX56175.1 GNAT family N-acetyltransferase [Myxococcus sp. CA039A]NTX62753.1 GNAT family N-acetyltransferase [Myxococcus sp. CA051A]